MLWLHLYVFLSSCAVGATGQSMLLYWYGTCMYMYAFIIGCTGMYVCMYFVYVCIYFVYVCMYSVYVCMYFVYVCMYVVVFVMFIANGYQVA